MISIFIFEDISFGDFRLSIKVDNSSPVIEKANDIKMIGIIDTINPFLNIFY